MVQPLPATQNLHHSFTAFPASVTSSRVQQLVQEPQSRACCGACGAAIPGTLKPCPSRTSSFCFSRAFNARSTLRRDSPVASITALIVAAPPSTARATFDITGSIFFFRFFFFFKVFERTIAGVEEWINVLESHPALPRMHDGVNTASNVLGICASPSEASRNQAECSGREKRSSSVDPRE